MGGSGGGEALYRTIQANDSRGSRGATKANKRDTWDKGRFLALLEIAARKEGTWIDDIKTLTSSLSAKKGKRSLSRYTQTSKDIVLHLSNI